MSGVGRWERVSLLKANAFNRIGKVVIIHMENVCKDFKVPVLQCKIGLFHDWVTEIEFNLVWITHFKQAWQT